MQIQINKSPPQIMLSPTQASDISAGLLFFSLTPVTLDVEPAINADESPVDDEQDITMMLNNPWLPLPEQLTQPCSLSIGENAPALELVDKPQDVEWVSDGDANPGLQQVAIEPGQVSIAKPQDIGIGQKNAEKEQRDAGIWLQNAGFELRDIAIGRPDADRWQQNVNTEQKNVDITLQSIDIKQPGIDIANGQQNIANAVNVKQQDTNIEQQNVSIEQVISADDLKRIANLPDSLPSGPTANLNQSTEQPDLISVNALQRANVDHAVLQQPKNPEKNTNLSMSDSNQPATFPDIMSNKMMVVNTANDGIYQRVAPAASTVIADALASYQAPEVISQLSDTPMDVNLATYHAKLNLFQPELGQVTADIAVTNHHTDITFTTANRDATQMIENSLRQLHDTFDQADLMLTHVTIQNNLAHDKQELYKKFTEKEDNQKALASSKPLTQQFSPRRGDTDWLVDTYA